MGGRTEHPPSDEQLRSFVEHVCAQGAQLYRHFPWRETRDAYAILVSEVMLQQTQVTRVGAYHERWLADFPDLEALAAAPLEAVLRAWQGLGYNRRAVALKRTAETVVARHVEAGRGGSVVLPNDDALLRALPGIGPATAAGVRAFAFGEVVTYLETNVRTVFLHELFADSDDVADARIAPLVERAAQMAAAAGVSSRTWNYALLDYGAHLKKTVPNPSRRSAHHVRQSAFEGSRRQKRAWLLRAVMDAPGVSHEALAEELGIEADAVEELLEELAAEGFLVRTGSGWAVA